MKHKRRSREENLFGSYSNIFFTEIPEKIVSRNYLNADAIVIKHYMVKHEKPALTSVVVLKTG